MGDVSVRDFGARGDGVTFDTKSVQAAVDAAAKERGGVVRFPPGTYRNTAFFFFFYWYSYVLLTGYLSLHGPISGMWISRGKWPTIFCSKPPLIDPERTSLNVTGLFNVATKATDGSAAAITALTPFPWAAATFMGESIGSAHYNSLQLSAEKRYSNGLQFLIAYTWSKAMDDGGSGYFGVENGPGGGAATQNFYNIKSDWGVSAYDIKEYLSASIMYELPAGKGKRLLNHGAAAAILGGWQVNTITSLRSGQPYNLDVVNDVANIGDTLGWSYARPNVIGSWKVSSPTAQEYFNPGAFSIPVNSFGNFGKDVLRSAGVYNVDFSLFKTFPIKESVKLEFRAEAFNIFNIQNLSPPGVDIGTADAGVVSSVAVPPREIQLGMKLRF